MIDGALVRSLAREYGRPERDVERILHEEMTEILAEARIETFVTVLAASRVRARLRVLATTAH